MVNTADKQGSQTVKDERPRSSGRDAVGLKPPILTSQVNPSFFVFAPDAKPNRLSDVHQCSLGNPTEYTNYRRLIDGIMHGTFQTVSLPQPRSTTLIRRPVPAGGPASLSSVRTASPCSPRAISSLVHARLCSS